jgi:hypothetical protein
VGWVCGVFAVVAPVTDDSSEVGSVVDSSEVGSVVLTSAAPRAAL